MEALVIGLDGGTFSVIEPLTRSGHMPNLKQALERGRTGVLLSTIPPVTVLAWPSFITGRNPGRHGLLSWQEPLNEDFARPLVNSSRMRGAKLWHLVGEAGLQTCVLNVPTTYPPEPVYGAMVTGMLTPGMHVQFTHPPELREALLSAVPDYQIDIDVRTSRPDVADLKAVRQFLHGATAVTRSRGKALRWLIGQREPHVVVTVFELPDRLQHLFWRYIACLPDPVDDTARSRAIQTELLACLKVLDEEIGALLRELPPGGYLTLLSDHGFGPLETSVHLDDWLAQQGWLTYDSRRRRRWEVFRQAGSRLKSFMPGRLLERARAALPLSDTVDWEQTMAYAGLPSECGIFVNVRGREPAGVVAADDYEALRSEIIDALVEWRDPRSQAPVVAEAYRREELYTGPHVRLAPDIVLQFGPGYWPSDLAGRRGSLSDMAGTAWGIHGREGIFAMSGPGIGTGQQRLQLHIQDVMPTLLYALGLPVPDDLDGQVCLEVFAPEWQASHPVVSQAATGLHRVEEPHGYSGDDEALVSKRLRGLGYLE